MLLRNLLLFLLIISGGALCQELTTPTFQSGSVVLLQPESEFNERLASDVEGLAAYIKALSSTFEEEVGCHSHGEPTSGVLVVAVRPKGRSRVWLEFGNNPKPEQLLGVLHDKLLAVEPPLVWNGPISFLVEFELWGGGSPLTSHEGPVFLPIEWREVIARLDRPTDTETILDAIWPDEG